MRELSRCLAGDALLVDDDMANLRGCPCGVVHVATKRGVGPFEVISQKVFIDSFRKSQFPHKFVNVLFIFVMIKARNYLSPFAYEPRS